MHVVQVVAVRCDADDNVEDEATRTLENVHAADQWFDWFEVGGRWDGFFGKRYQNDLNNVLSFATHPDLVRQHLDESKRHQGEFYLRLRDAVLGTPVEFIDDSEGHILGFPVLGSPDAARKATEFNRDVAAGWNAILKAGSLEEARKADPSYLGAYQMGRLLDSYHGKWNSDSGYFDLENNTTEVGFAQAELDDSFHLVAVDFHY